MTEREWLECTAPPKLLAFVGHRLSPRRLRLLACACCRAFWHLFPDERLRRAVEVGEELADRRVSTNMIGGAVNDVFQAQRTASDVQIARVYGEVRVLLTPLVTVENVVGLLGQMWLAPDIPGEVINEAFAERIKDVAGVHFREVSCQPAWLTWRDGVVGKLAQAAYDVPQFPDGLLDPVRLAVLSDALEEAGCDDDEVLGHLRAPGPHVRGCWCVDLLLNKH